MRDSKSLGCYSNWSKSRLTKSSQIPHRVQKRLSKYMKMLTNWIKKVGKLIGDGKTTHSCFFLAKMKQDDVGQKQGKFP